MFFYFLKINRDKKISLSVSLICCNQCHLLMKLVIICKYFFSNVDDGKNIFDFLRKNIYSPEKLKEIKYWSKHFWLTRLGEKKKSAVSGNYHAAFLHVSRLTCHVSRRCGNWSHLSQGAISSSAAEFVTVKCCHSVPTGTGAELCRVIALNGSQLWW